MNILDKAIKPFSPSWALKRAQARSVLAAYEATKISRTRKNPSDNASANTLTASSTTTLRGQARHLDQNHDLCRGILNNLVTFVVGPKGILVEPSVMTKDGKLDEEVNRQIRAVIKEWSRKPETTHQMSWAKVQRTAARAWFRDGECLAKFVSGAVPSLRHGTNVPFSIEMLEADHIADTVDDDRVVQGVEVNGWGQPTYYHMLDSHPSNALYVTGKTRKINANSIVHLKAVDRFQQVRGVSIFASVMNRLNDLKDYEESERIAAKISANMAAYIKKGSPDNYINPNDEDEREFELGQGMIWDNLLPGEEVGTIQSSRPSALLQPFRNSMVKAISAGTQSGDSSNSKTYDGSYSSQRQELVEQWIHYASIASDFVDQFVEPIMRQLIQVAVASGKIKLGKKTDLDTLYDADYLPPAMPWIDPKKEADGFEKLIDMKITSPQKVIRKRGDNPTEVLEQTEQWQKELDKRGLKEAEPNKPAPAGFFTTEEK